MHQRKYMFNQMHMTDGLKEKYQVVYLMVCLLSTLALMPLSRRLASG